MEAEYQPDNCLSFVLYSLTIQNFRGVALNMNPGDVHSWIQFLEVFFLSSFIKNVATNALIESAF